MRKREKSLKRDTSRLLSLRLTDEISQSLRIDRKVKGGETSLASSLELDRFLNHESDLLPSSVKKKKISIHAEGIKRRKKILCAAEVSPPSPKFFEEEREVEKRKKGKKAEGGNTIHHQDITLAPLSLVREQRRRRKNERGKEENKKSEKKVF